MADNFAEPDGLGWLCKTQTATSATSSIDVAGFGSQLTINTEWIYPPRPTKRKFWPLPIRHGSLSPDIALAVSPQLAFQRNSTGVTATSIKRKSARANRYRRCKSHASEKQACDWSE